MNKIINKNNENRKIKLQIKAIEKKKKVLSRKLSKLIIKQDKVFSFSDPKDKNFIKKLNNEKYIIEVFDLCKSYFSGIIENKILKNLNFKINNGEFIVILGPSGSGKTSLLNLLSGLDSATSGDVFVNMWNLSLLKDNHLTLFRRKTIGFIFQQYNLLPNLTARENIDVCSNLSIKKNDKFIDDIINVIGLREHINKYPYQLSGGQQQRVSIARALAKNPKILFCDEPTGALDVEMGCIVIDVLKKINKKFNTTIIFVTHNIKISKVASKVLMIRDGEISSFKRNKKIFDVADINWY